MKKLTLILMAVVLGVLLTMPAFAFGRGEGGGSAVGKGDCSCSKPVLWQLNLSAEQKTKIEALISENQKAIRPLREKMFDKSVALRRLWSQANPDKDKITAAQKEVRKLRDEKQDRVTAMRLEIRKILTPEQNEKLANSHWGRGPGFGPRGGARGHDGHGPGMEICP
jgi:P pilus assembly/Cpx signaling pathway, periplasmic inhibitor/zinc-resistance associated protein